MKNSKKIRLCGNQNELTNNNDDNKIIIMKFENKIVIQIIINIIIKR